MRKNLYRAFSALMIVAVLASSTMSSFAALPPAVVETGKFVAESFGGWFIEQSLEHASNFVKDHIGYSAGKQCKSSSDGYHHCESSAFGSGLHGEDENGRFSSVVCRFCGELFKYYSSFGKGGGAGFSGKSDLEQSYSAQVSSLPSSNYNSGGELRWRLKTWATGVYEDGRVVSFKPGTQYSCQLDSSSETLDCTIWFDKFVAPVTGNYDLWCFLSADESYSLIGRSIYSGGGSYRFILNSDTGKSEYAEALGRSDVGVVYPNTGLYMFPDSHGISAGAVIFDKYQYFRLRRLQALNYTTATGYWELSCVPTTLPENTYTVNSRPTSITGDYGIIGDNGQITKVEGNTIVNETNNTYYNPATGTSDTITDWSYNYEDRSYDLTLDGGTKTTVTYGDENVTIKEGDTTYNVYYLVEDTAAEPPDPATPCNHDWTETSSTPPTCTVPGSKLLTCSLCGQTKTEPIPAPGHDWQIKQTVQTQYDETGQLTQQGYTIFECSVCHEQYKSEDGAAPPGDSGPSDDVGGFLDSLADMITGKLESVLETVTSIFYTVPSFFDGFLGFLSAMFPFLPKEIITLLTFGIAAVVFIGIIKAIRR